VASKPSQYGDRIVTWKKALLIALVLLLVLIGIPVLMPGMGGATCHDCGPAMAAGQACSLLAVLSGFALAIVLLSLSVRSRRDRLRLLLRALDLERPPRLA
jgi:uncharacterized sodium:solute symporter family permease YidK